MTRQIDDSRYARRILSAIEQTSDGVVLTDMDGNIEYANHAWLMMHDIRFSEVNGMNVGDAYDGDERKKILACFENIAETGEYAAEFTHKRAGEHLLPTLVLARVIKDDVGNAVGVNLFERDVSKMRELEGTLNVMRESFLNIVQKSIIGMLVIDEDGIILFANPTAEQLFGREVDSLVDQPLGIPVLEGSMTETGILRSGGDPGIAAMSMTRTEWEGKQAYLVMLNDITEQKRAADEIRRLLQFKSDILANLSHELRTPINNIIGYVELSVKHPEAQTGDKGKMFLERTIVNAKNLLGIVNGLLDAASLEAEETSINQTSFNLGDLVAACVENEKILNATEGVSVKTDFGGRAVQIVSDKEKVETIAGCLISNALKFTKQGEVSISVKKLEHREGWVRIEVKDTGIGIPDKEISQIYEGFKQLDSSMTRKYGGLGMGLFLVNWYVKILGGEIQVESELGVGSTFTVNLPIKYVREQHK